MIDWQIVRALFVKDAIEAVLGLGLAAVALVVLLLPQIYYWFLGRKD